MRKRLVAAVLMALAAGCTGQADTGASETNWTDKIGAAITPGEWSLEKAASGIDGEKLIATRAFNFEDRNTHFIVNIACTTGSGAVDFNIQSFVGDAANPSEESQLVSQAVGSPITQSLAVATLSHMPRGRIRTGTGEVEDLSTYFRIDETYGNFANFVLSFEVMSRLIERELGRSPNNEHGFLAVAPKSGDINVANQIANSLPMTVEVTNGTGSFELEIRSAPEVATALQGCGSNRPLLAENYLKQLQEAIPASSKTEQDAPALADVGANAAESGEGSSDTQESPSFDCKQAKSHQEKLICSDATLAILDDAMADNYAAIAASDIGDGAKKDLKSTQREWLKARDKCADKDCLASLYRDRLDTVCDYPVISGAHPICTSSEEIE